MCVCACVCVCESVCMCECVRACVRACVRVCEITILRSFSKIILALPRPSASARSLCPPPTAVTIHH